MQKFSIRAVGEVFSDLSSSMPIFTPRAPKRGLAGLLRRRKETPQTEPVAKQQLKPEQIARLFDKTIPSAQACEPRKLQASEEQDREELSSLRGALYRRS